MISGIVFGLTAGLSPGPLLTLLISETLHHNRKAGITIAFAPLITDIPIVFITIFLFTTISGIHLVAGIISIFGALFLGYLAYENFTAKPPTQNVQAIQPHSLRKGVMTNILSPHPYIFWFAVGAPTVLNAYNNNVLSAICFVVGFYICLVGSKVIVAIVADKSKAFLKSTFYIYSIRILGLFLLFFALLFMRDGLAALGVL